MQGSCPLAPDGQPVRLIELRHPCGTRLDLMDWGATWLSCKVKVARGEAREVLLGCARIEDWFAQTAYLGATVGRYANRIAFAQIPHHCGGALCLHPNEEGGHQLHGGPQGFSHRRWQVIERSEQHVRMTIDSEDGDQGFPGKLRAQVSYRLLEDQRIASEYWAQVDAPCPVNLTNHAYFNLDGRCGDIRAHSLSIAASHYLPTDASLIPLGHLEPVARTSFDFRRSRRIDAGFLQDAQQRQAGGYDHAWLLDAACRDMNNAAATLISTDHSLSMNVFTSMPALQFYSGNKLAGVPNREGTCYGAYEGVALETQFLPDSPNHPEWPQASCWLQPGQCYRHRTDLVFSARTV